MTQGVRFHEILLGKFSIPRFEIDTTQNVIDIGYPVVVRPAYTMGGGTYSRCLKNAITFGLGMRSFSARPENLPAGHGGAHAPDEFQSITALFESTLVFLSSVLKLDKIV